jgi:hypothetical protein
MQDQWENYVVSSYGLECTLPEGSCNSVSLDQQRYSSADQQTGMEMGAFTTTKYEAHRLDRATARYRIDTLRQCLCNVQKKEGITFSIKYYLASHHHDRW